MIDFDDHLLKNWFDEKELPLINNVGDFLQAFSEVKSRFNGAPDKYTRKDYLIFINTVYASLRRMFDSGIIGLSDDIKADIDVGFVKKGELLTQGTSFQDLMEHIFIGQQWTITYKYINVSTGTEIQPDKIVKARDKDVLNISIDDAPTFKGLALESISQAGEIVVTSDLTIIYKYKNNVVPIFFGQLGEKDDEIFYKNRINFGVEHSYVDLLSLESNEELLNVGPDINVFYKEQTKQIHYLLIPKNIELLSAKLITNSVVSTLYDVNQENNLNYLTDISEPSIYEGVEYYGFYFYSSHVREGLIPKIELKFKLK